MYSVSAYSLEHYQPNHLDLIFFSPVFVCACVCVCDGLTLGDRIHVANLLLSFGSEICEHICRKSVDYNLKYNLLKLLFIYIYIYIIYLTTVYHYFTK